LLGMRMHMGNLSKVKYSSLYIMALENYEATQFFISSQGQSWWSKKAQKAATKVR